LSLRERIGQLVIAAVRGDFTNFQSERFLATRQQIQQDRLGGFIIHGGDPNEIAALTNEMQRLAKVPLFFTADYEWGLRMQLHSGTPFTTNMAIAAAADPEAAYRLGKVVAEEMRAIGVNWLFAPVGDINNNPDNPVINSRSFGEDPERVSQFVAAMVRGVRDGGALSTAKHFPGHGDTATDSHIGLPTITVDRKRLDTLELIPFRAAIRAGVDAIMTAHIALPNVTGDAIPATLSPKLTTDLLRRELGFDGIIVTDSLGMGAIVKGYGNAEAAVKAIVAGADVVLLSPDPRAAIDAIEAAVKRGEITQNRIDESVQRLLRAKYRLGLAKRREIDLSAVNRIVERPDGMRDAASVAEHSVTLLRNQNNLLPLDLEKIRQTLFLVLAADEDPSEGRTFIPQIRQRWPAATIERADPRTTAAEYDSLYSEAEKSDLIVIAAFVKRAALKGTVALPDLQASLVRKLIAAGKPVAVMAFGSPYLVAQFPDVPAYLTTYATEDVAQAAAVRALFGEIPISGQLPVRIPDLFELGAGIQLSPRSVNKDANK
jgi:beta-N-acetylhexosaminidase